MSLHSRPQLTDLVKLASLRQALKDWSARYLIEDLSGSGSSYNEAIKMLRKRYDPPRLLHKVHVRAVIEAPALKDGIYGRELRILHVTLSQNLRALKGTESESLGRFLDFKYRAEIRRYLYI